MVQYLVHCSKINGLNAFCLIRIKNKIYKLLIFSKRSIMTLSKMTNSSIILKVKMEMMAMLVIQYVNGQTNAEKVYQKAAEFVANQQL